MSHKKKGPKLIERAKALWFSTPLENFKQGLLGQMIRLRNPERYKHLKEIRPSRRLLVQQKKKLIAKVETALNQAGITPIKFFVRIKTLGSLNRKEKYASTMNLQDPQEYLKEDFLGLTILVKTKQECYAAINALKKTGEFPQLKDRKNPRDYFEKPAKSRGTSDIMENLLTGNLLVKELFPIHVMVFTKESFIHTRARRGIYKKDMAKKIKAAGKQ